MCELGESCKKVFQKICHDSFFDDVNSLVATFLEFPSSQFFMGHNHNWGVKKEYLTPKSSTRHILNDYYVYRFIYFSEFIFSLDVHIF
jgi:hypothetical protein